MSVTISCWNLVDDEAGEFVLDKGSVVTGLIGSAQEDEGEWNSRSTKRVEGGVVLMCTLLP